MADLEHSHDDDRWFAIGMAINGATLAVVYVWSESVPGSAKVRIISARHAT